MADVSADRGRSEAEHPILVPLDGSTASERALQYAGLIPSRWVRLLAVEPIELSAARMRWARGEIHPSGATWLVESAGAYLELVAYPLRQQGWNVEIVVTSGKPGPQVVAAAADAEITVMATRRDGLAKFLLGSTAEYVANHAGVPTLLIRDEMPEDPAILRLVVPMDGSEASADVLPLAVVLRRGLGADLHLTRVVDPSASLKTTDDLEREAAAYLEQQITRLGERAAGTSYEIRVGEAVEQILAGLLPGDLLVMATRGHGRFGRMLGSDSQAVFERAPAPVVLVRAAPGAMAGARSAVR